MSQDKQALIAQLREEFERWETLLAGMSEAQRVARTLPSNWSIKDVMAHLMAWQQRSIARLEAALLEREPRFPDWPTNLDPEIDDEPDELNAWIYETYRDQSWAQVHGAWRDGYLRLLDLAEAIPERALFDTEKYSWLDGHSLADVLLGTYEHHREDHREPLLDRLRQQG